MEHRSDNEIVEILAKTIRTFNDLPPSERRKVRNRNRWRYVDGTRRFRSSSKWVEALELWYDVADRFS